MTEANGNAFDYFVERHLREGRGDQFTFADPWLSPSYGELAVASVLCRRVAGRGDRARASGGKLA